MKFYPGKILLSHKGEEMEEVVPKGGLQKITLGVVTVEALLRELPQDQNAPGKTKVQRWSLAQLVQKNISQKEMILSAEDIALIKSRIEQAFPATIVGPSSVAIEG